MSRVNCWEFMKCGLEPGGVNVETQGICPASFSGLYDGMNRGSFAGRFCWAIKGTICECKKQGTKEEQLMRCINCEFTKSVHDDEGSAFVLMPPDGDYFK